jgi:hypothetical protein
LVQSGQYLFFQCSWKYFKQPMYLSLVPQQA